MSAGSVCYWNATRARQRIWCGIKQRVCEMVEGYQGGWMSEKEIGLVSIEGRFKIAVMVCLNGMI